jgi:hypothetical protein
MHGVETLLADREARNFHQWGLADATVGGKQNGEETCSYLGGPAFFGTNLMNPNLTGLNLMGS